MTRAERLRQEFRGTARDKTWTDEGIDYLDLTAEDTQPIDEENAPLPTTVTNNNRFEGGRAADAIKSAKTESTVKRRWWK